MTSSAKWSQAFARSRSANHWSKAAFKNANGEWHIGTSRGFLGDEFYIDRIGTVQIEFEVKPNGDAVVAGNLGLGTSTPAARLDVRGTTRTCVLTITGGCDIAEPFLVKEPELEKGSVVVIDDEHPGRLKLSTQSCDTRVAGIVSGANGVHTGLALQQDGVFDAGQKIALSGRVYVKADAAFGAIRPGDLLTTSGTPGHAMKVRDRGQAQGAILGKAMSDLKAGKGMVLVLVTLQ